MANEITPPGTARPLRTPPIKSVTDKQKAIAQQKKKPKPKPDESAKSEGDDQIHIDEYI